jgi:hypothetical protein
VGNRSDEDDTPLERPRRSSVVVTCWGKIDAWVASRDGRYYIGTAGPTFRVVDEAVGEEIVKVGPDEEPSVALWRAVQALISRAGG